MKFISRELSAKDVRVVGGRGVAKSGRRWAESNTLSFRENYNMLFEDTRLVADR